MFGVDLPRVRFTVSGGKGRKRSVEVSSQLIKLGSKSGLVHVELPETDARPIHASVRVAPDGRLWLVDTSSGVGTRLNGAVVERAELFDGDTIRIGKSKVSVRVEGGGRERDDGAADTVSDAEATHIPGLRAPAVPPSVSHPEGLTVELEPDCVAVCPGQHLEGTITVPSAWGDDLETLELCCRWEAGEDSGEEQLMSWSCEALGDGTRRVPFALTAPDGPLSHEGELIHLQWCARATAVVDGTPRHAHAGFVLAPWAEEPLIPTAKGYRGAPRRWRADYTLGPSTLPPGTLEDAGLRGGLLQGVWGGWLADAQAAVQQLWVELEVAVPPTTHAGAPLAVAVNLRALRDVNISDVTCVLSAREFSRAGDRKWTSANEHVVYEAATPGVEHPRSLAAGEETRIDVMLSVPTNAPPSFGADHSVLVWTVAVDVAIDHCPDSVTEEIVTVRPAPPP